MFEIVRGGSWKKRCFLFDVIVGVLGFVIKVEVNIFSKGNFIKNIYVLF